ncbi:hypothetical protein AMTR_s00106p00111260 [Amborella trichopoda]|uniref:Aminotransferase-like plant mobile domain-containing protein n=1 Tax=Amborella trichopoda TaxID=13333 RepID=W1NZG0_AMBTC|nr:hypothetical protein AMTR_s00106p00111260 [Amborella trichopoda]
MQRGGVQRPIHSITTFKLKTIVPTRGNLTTIKHSWLKANFRELPPDATPVKVVRYVHAYLLFLISVTIFVDASVATVLTRYLQLVEDIEEAGRYAWGAAAVAYFYRSCGKACTFKRTHFSSSATLMQVIWNPYFGLDEAILDDRYAAFQTAMCIMTLIFNDIAEPYMSNCICRIPHILVRGLANKVGSEIGEMLIMTKCIIGCLAMST